MPSSSALQGMYSPKRSYLYSGYLYDSQLYISISASLLRWGSIYFIPFKNSSNKNFQHNLSKTEINTEIFPSCLLSLTNVTHRVRKLGGSYLSSSLPSSQSTSCEILSTLPPSNLPVCPLFPVHWGGLVQAFISSCRSHKSPPNLFLCLWSSLPPILGEDFTDCPETRGWHEKSMVWWFSTYRIKKLSRWVLRLFYQLTKLLFPFWTPSPSASGSSSLPWFIHL